MQSPQKTPPSKKFAIAWARSPAREARALPGTNRAFTLIELLVVIAIIVVLVGLLFPAFKAVQNQARSTQAKNDLTQIVNAVNAFYTDYGKYPLPSTATVGADCVFTASITGVPNSYGNDWLLNELRGCPTAGGGPACSANGPSNNTRQIVYLSPPLAKDTTNPKSGIGTTGISLGRFFDPWGSPYNLEFDSSYNNQVANPYTAGAGVNPLPQGAIGWSNGPDLQLGTNSDGIYTNSDDAITWQ
jgi:prepilin-type N-terminal cleavage/methylation domain-containing protein